MKLSNGLRRPHQSPPGDEEEEITADEAPRRSLDPTSQKKSLRNTPLPKPSRLHPRDGGEAGETLLKIKSLPPPHERHHTKA
jgi:hypothetical protein